MSEPNALPNDDPNLSNSPTVPEFVEPIDLTTSEITGDVPEPEEEDVVEVDALDMHFTLRVKPHAQFDRPMKLGVKQATLLNNNPWVRPIGKLTMNISTQAWKFLVPGEVILPIASEEPQTEQPEQSETPDDSDTDAELPEEENPFVDEDRPKTRLKPPTEVVGFRDRLMYMLQPPLEDLFSGKQVTLPFKPYPYQLKGIAFLMPRHAAMIADEMGLGKTAQVIIAMRLMFHSGLLKNALVVCPKPLVVNWTRELRLWAEDIPFEVVGGDSATRKYIWFESKCPLKLVNYEILTRDEEWVCDERVQFDLVSLDEAQRIKNKTSKTAEVVCNIHRQRSWAMTGTPIENRVDDLVNIFTFVDKDRIPPDTPARMIPSLTQDSIIRRVKEDVVSDMPPRIYRDSALELTAAQRHAYDLAEKEGVVHLNDLGDTITCNTCSNW